MHLNNGDGSSSSQMSVKVRRSSCSEFVSTLFSFRSSQIFINTRSSAAAPLYARRTRGSGCFDTPGNPEGLWGHFRSLRPLTIHPAAVGDNSSALPLSYKQVRSTCERNHGDCKVSGLAVFAGTFRCWCLGMLTPLKNRSSSL